MLLLGEVLKLDSKLVIQQLVESLDDEVLGALVILKLGALTLLHLESTVTVV